MRRATRPSGSSAAPTTGGDAPGDCRTPWHRRGSRWNTVRRHPNVCAPRWISTRTPLSWFPPAQVHRLSWAKRVEQTACSASLDKLCLIATTVKALSFDNDREFLFQGEKQITPYIVVGLERGGTGGDGRSSVVLIRNQGTTQPAQHQRREGKDPSGNLPVHDQESIV